MLICIGGGIRDSLVKVMTAIFNILEKFIVFTYKVLIS